MKSSSWHPSSRKAKTYSSCVCVCCRVGVSAFQKQTRPQMGKFFGGNGCIYYLVLGIKGICICPNSSIYTHLIHVPSKRTSVKLRNAEPIHRQMRVPVWTHCSVCQSGGVFFFCLHFFWSVENRNEQPGGPGTQLEGHWWLRGSYLLLLRACLSAESGKAPWVLGFCWSELTLLLAIMETIWFQDVEMVIKSYWVVWYELNE